jgi:site-specific DNA recombinase
VRPVPRISRVKSTRAESLIKDNYDDGGFSGDTMKRPTLKQLLDDILAGKVERVIVYKVDRLTRSLSDFAKVIEVFDSHR